MIGNNIGTQCFLDIFFYIFKCGPYLELRIIVLPGDEVFINLSRLKVEKKEAY